MATEGVGREPALELEENGHVLVSVDAVDTWMSSTRVTVAGLPLTEPVPVALSPYKVDY